MPLLVLPLLIVLALLAVLLLTPLALVQRYRLGTSRQRTRGWLAAINFIALLLSAGILVGTAAMTTLWVPGTLTYAVSGLCIGVLLGVVGLWLTRWESSADALHYTPNRLLVLSMTLLVAGRLLYSAWRGWHSWSVGIQGGSWFVAAGVPGSMAAGAVVLGYYLMNWTGVRRRHRRHVGHRLRSV